MKETYIHPCEHHVHEQATSRHEHEPVISERWKWTTVLGNAAIGACELATGSLSTLSVTADGVHNVGDTATYYMQAENILNPDLSEQRRMRMRKAAHYIIAASSLGISAKAGFDLAQGHESAQHAMTTYAAGASLLLNGLLLTRLRKGMKRRNATEASVHEQDLSKHFWAIDIPSAALALAGSVLQKYNVGIEQVAAVASGLVGVYAFRPTEANLAHNCLSHSHDETPPILRGRHRYAGDGVCPGASDKSWLERITYEPRHGKASTFRLGLLSLLGRLGKQKA